MGIIVNSFQSHKEEVCGVKWYIIITEFFDYLILINCY